MTRLEGHGRASSAEFAVLRDFCRNATMACAIGSLLILGAAVAGSAPENGWGWGLAAMAATGALFYRFLRFYRHYEADVLNAFSVLPVPEPAQQ